MKDAISIVRVFRHSIRLYVSQARYLLTTSAIAGMMVAVISALPLAISGLFGALALAVNIGVVVLFTAAVIELVSEFRAGKRNPRLRVVICRVRPALGQLLASGLVTGIIMSFLFFLGSALASGLLIGSALVARPHLTVAVPVLIVVTAVFFVPGLLLLTVWSVVAPVAVLERPGRLRSLARSRELVGPSRWRVLAAIIVLLMPLGIIAVCIALLSNVVGSVPGIIAGVLVSIIVAPIPPLVSTLLYFELAGFGVGGMISTPAVG
jgi:hypothetical protein